MGIILSLIAALFAASKDLLSKKISFSAPSAFSAFASFFCALPFYLILIVALYFLGYEDFSVTKGFFIFVLLRGFLDVGAEWFKMAAYENGDISLIAPIFGITPIFILILGPFINGDTIPAQGIVGVFLVVCGSIVLSTPSRTYSLASQKKGVILALLGTIFFAIMGCIDREAVRLASPAITGASMTVVSAMVLLIPALIQSKVTTLLWTLKTPLLIRGAAEVGFMTIRLMALVYLPAAYVSSILKISLLLKVIGGGVFFKEKGILKKALSTILIIIGVVCLISL